VSGAENAIRAFLPAESSVLFGFVHETEKNARIIIEITFDIFICLSGFIDAVASPPSFTVRRARTYSLNVIDKIDITAMKTITATVSTNDADEPFII
jgi:hypothetical protein